MTSFFFSVQVHFRLRDYPAPIKLKGGPKWSRKNTTGMN